ncbi:hypothetical protein PanWU01x14_307340 [Parasponia andersonii]|uniref:Uncharacterized protein n=1 Tax=Parasponia andersonii TaxID=3476 RepID=A0A2P5ARB8_PARAD|nr:hypothetical protein PanWU01x14_307340 [Parasponia andersonii]
MRLDSWKFGLADKGGDWRQTVASVDFSAVNNRGLTRLLYASWLSTSGDGRRHCFVGHMGESRPDLMA